MTKVYTYPDIATKKYQQKGTKGHICSNNETFDPGANQKTWTNKARRKFVASNLSAKLREYELTLPKNQRGAWNNRIAYEYVPRLNENAEIVVNKFGETQYEKTDIEQRQSLYYNHLDNTGNQLRWRRLAECHSTITEATDQTTGEIIYKATYKCNDKLCGNCSQIRSIIAITKYKDKVFAMRNPVQIVLHTRNAKMGELKPTIDRMYKDWRQILKVQTKSTRENYNGILALETTTNETDPDNKTYHPHYHIIVEQHQAEEIVKKWVNMDTDNRTLFAHTHKKTGKLYSELPTDDKGNFTIKELFKYAMKMSVTNQGEDDSKYKTIASVEMIYEIAKALKGVQQWRPFGNFRATPNTKEISQAIENEMIVNHQAWPHIFLSKQWYWNIHDWEATDIPGLTLTGYIPTQRDKEFLRLQTESFP